jgi:AcrR family transcriptional regulator
MTDWSVRINIFVFNASKLKGYIMKKEQNLRSKIVKNALKIFTKKGFFRTTVDDIAKAAGVGKGTVYLYFKDKSALYVSIIEDHFVTGIQYLKEVQSESLSSTEKLQKIAGDWIDYMIQLKSSFFMFSMENLNLSRKIMKEVRPIMLKNLKEMIGIVAHIIDQGIRTGEFRKVNSQIAALHFLNTIRTGFYINLFIPEISVDKKTALKLFFEGLKIRR